MEQQQQEQLQDQQHSIVEEARALLAMIAEGARDERTEEIQSFARLTRIIKSSKSSHGTATWSSRRRSTLRWIGRRKSVRRKLRTTENMRHKTLKFAAGHGRCARATVADKLAAARKLFAATDELAPSPCDAADALRRLDNHVYFLDSGLTRARRMSRTTNLRGCSYL